MRFLLCFVIWIVFVGGLYAYTEKRDSVVVPARAADPAQAEVQDRLNGMAVDIADLPISRGQTLFIRDLGFELADHNEVFVKASPPVAESSLTHGIRLRLLSHDRVLADETVWSSGGGLVSGTVPFSLNDTPGTDHDH